MGHRLGMHRGWLMSHRRRAGHSRRGVGRGRLCQREGHRPAALAKGGRRCGRGLRLPRRSVVRAKRRRRATCGGSRHLKRRPGISHRSRGNGLRGWSLLVERRCLHRWRCLRRWRGLEWRPSAKGTRLLSAHRRLGLLRSEGLRGRSRGHRRWSTFARRRQDRSRRAARVLERAASRRRGEALHILLRIGEGRGWRARLRRHLRLLHCGRESTLHERARWRSRRREAGKLRSRKRHRPRILRRYWALEERRADPVNLKDRNPGPPARQRALDHLGRQVDRLARRQRIWPGEIRRQQRQHISHRQHRLPAVWREGRSPKAARRRLHGLRLRSRIRCFEQRAPKTLLTRLGESKRARVHGRRGAGGTIHHGSSRCSTEGGR